MRLEPSLTGYVLALAFAVLTAAVFGFYPRIRLPGWCPSRRWRSIDRGNG
jgi:hypothetical protein